MSTLCHRARAHPTARAKVSDRCREPRFNKPLGVPEPWLRPRQCRRGADPACGVPACTGEDLLAHQPSALILRASLALVQAHVTERRTQARTASRILPRRSGTTPLGAGLASPGSAGQQLAAAVRSTCDAGSAPRHPVARHVESSGSTCRCSDATRSPSDLRGQVPGSTGRATPQDAPRNRSIGCSMGSTKRSGGRRRRGMIDRPTIAVRESSWGRGAMPGARPGQGRFGGVAGASSMDEFGASLEWRRRSVGHPCPSEQPGTVSRTPSSSGRAAPGRRARARAAAG
jgi:hypothetical protein